MIGFIGTFGPWHGAEVLARAFGALIERYPRYRSDVRLLMIGDGVKMPEVRAALDRGGVTDLTTLTGIVAQAEGPSYLAACDILASPHVANADGTPFFGSPTKLFEYMAMGKAHRRIGSRSGRRDPRARPRRADGRFPATSTRWWTACAN